MTLGDGALGDGTLTNLTSQSLLVNEKKDELKLQQIEYQDQTTVTKSGSEKSPKKSKKQKRKDKADQKELEKLEQIKPKIPTMSVADPEKQEVA